MGELSGDYTIYGRLKGSKEVWRVSEDGEVRDTFNKLRYIFEMDEQAFFDYYVENPISTVVNKDEYFTACITERSKLAERIPELPFSNVWIAKTIAQRIPEGSFIHFGVSNTMRSWTLFDVAGSVTSSANVGGRGIDGALSTLLGGSLVNLDKLHFGIMGDLTFFYDMNTLGNRHVGKNLRILLVNNGRGAEFRLYTHKGQKLMGDDADAYVAAAGHFGDKSPELAKSYVSALGFEFLSASCKVEFGKVIERFLTPEITERPILLEVFTDSNSENDAVKIIRNLIVPANVQAKDIAKGILGDRGVNLLKKAFKK
jgi:2-succinyl-5-enolpyruvyl-6-hydroxy-3-cyclohexene-1-carboxylate synthase